MVRTMWIHFLVYFTLIHSIRERKKDLIDQVLCRNLPMMFMECDSPYTFGVTNDDLITKYGCPRILNAYEIKNNLTIPHVKVLCHVFDGIECKGPRQFYRGNFPCIRLGTKRYGIAVLLAGFGGIFGADRFYLGYYKEGFLKLFTFGGFTIISIYDFINLVNNNYFPKDGSLWARDFI